jgi:vacuolar-type H+-ATPase subunit I/STV1
LQEVKVKIPGKIGKNPKDHVVERSLKEETINDGVEKFLEKLVEKSVEKEKIQRKQYTLKDVEKYSDRAPPGSNYKIKLEEIYTSLTGLPSNPSWNKSDLVEILEKVSKEENDAKSKSNTKPFYTKKDIIEYAKIAPHGGQYKEKLQDIYEYLYGEEPPKSWNKSKLIDLIKLKDKTL